MHPKSRTGASVPRPPDIRNEQSTCEVIYLEVRDAGGRGTEAAVLLRFCKAKIIILLFFRCLIYGFKVFFEKVLLNSFLVAYCFAIYYYACWSDFCSCEYLSLTRALRVRAMSPTIY